MRNYDKAYAIYGLFRIVRPSDFNMLKRDGCRFVSSSFILLYSTYSYKKFHIRFAPIASKKVGKAVVRNRAKRMIRSIIIETFKSFYNRFCGVLNLLIIARPFLLSKSYATLVREIKYCIHKIMHTKYICV